MLILTFFVVCGISLLARFNVTALELSDGGNKVKYFEGTPIPTSTFIVMVLGVAFAQEAIGGALWGGLIRLGPANLLALRLQRRRHDLRDLADFQVVTRATRSE